MAEISCPYEDVVLEMRRVFNEYVVQHRSPHTQRLPDLHLGSGAFRDYVEALEDLSRHGHIAQCTVRGEEREHFVFKGRAAIVINGAPWWSIEAVAHG